MVDFLAGVLAMVVGVKVLTAQRAMAFEPALAFIAALTGGKKSKTKRVVFVDSIKGSVIQSKVLTPGLNAQALELVLGLKYSVLAVATRRQPRLPL